MIVGWVGITCSTIMYVAVESLDIILRPTSPLLISDCADPTLCAFDKPELLLDFATLRIACIFCVCLECGIDDGVNDLGAVVLKFVQNS